MESCRCDAIVLATMDYREADRLVTLFTRELGKVRGVARGAKRSVRRFGGALELFARSSVELVPVEGLCRLQGADLQTLYPGIRRDLARIAYAGYAAELVDSLVPEGVPYPRIFRLLTTYLQHLEGSAEVSPSDRRFYEMNLLTILGYRPALDACGGCGVELSAAGRVFVGPAGQLLCERCGRGGRPVATSTLLLLRRCLVSGRFGSVVFAPPELAEAGSFLDLLLDTHLHRPLKSLAFLREMGEQSS
ncbi:MAG TPA: DNA repair protein RecO [Geobacteraceae bacterium]